MAKFDYLSWTLECNPSHLIDYLTSQIDLSQASPDTPKNGFERCVKIHRGENLLLRIYWGGINGSDIINVRATGSNAQAMHPFLQSYLDTYGVFHWATRMDSCEDFSAPGLFDRIAKQAIEYALSKNLKIGQVGDWQRDKERTLYIGSRQSEVYIRIYEKGQKLGGDPDWVRFETEVKPSSKNKSRRHAIACMHPGQILFLGQSGKLLNHLGWDHLEPTRLESIYSPTDTEKARAALVRQYGNIIRGWATELGGYEELAIRLRSEIETPCPA